MKKFILGLLTAVLAVNSLFADVEANLTLQLPNKRQFAGTIGHSDSVQHATYTESGIGGLGADINFFFLYPFFGDIGLNIYGNSTNLDNEKVSAANTILYEAKKMEGGTGIEFGLGPVLRFTVFDRHVFTTTFGANFNMSFPNEMTGFTSHTIETFYDVGYRFWFKNGNSFKMGIGADWRLANPIVSSVEYIEKEYENKRDFFDRPVLNVSRGTHSTLSLGLIFNFGNGRSASAKKASSTYVASTKDTSDYIGTWMPYNDKNKKAVGYITMNADNTGFFQYAPDGKNFVVDSEVQWELVEKGGKDYIRFSGCKLKDVNKEWECTLSDGILTFKKQICFGLYPNNTWTK